MIMLDDYIEKLREYAREWKLEEKLEVFKEKHKKEIKQIDEGKYLILMVLSLAYLTLTLIPLRVIISIGIFAFAAQNLIQHSIQTVLENGLVSYFPESLKHAFLNRSILDILCDLWFIPNLSLYFMAIIKPIIDQSISPEEAYRTLDHLEPEQKKVFITKGLAFLCPRKVRNYLLPQSYTLREVNEKNNLDDDDSTRSVKGENDDQQDRSLLDLMEELDFNLPIAARMKKNSESGVRLFEGKGRSRRNDNEGSLIKAKIDSAREIRPFDTQKPSSDGTVRDSKESFNEEEDSIFFKTRPKIELDDTMNDKKPLRPLSVLNSNKNIMMNTNRKRSRVILSSEWLKAMRDAPGRVDPKWDNYELYKNKQLKKDSSQGPSTESKLQILKLIMDLKSGNFIKNVDNKALISVGSISLVVVVLQLMFSRKVRRWSKDALTFLFYLLGSGAFVGSLGIILAKVNMSTGIAKKLLSSRKKKNNQTNK